MHVIMVINIVTGKFYPYYITKDINKAEELCGMMRKNDKNCYCYVMPIVDADKEINIKM